MKQKIYLYDAIYTGFLKMIQRWEKAPYSSPSEERKKRYRGHRLSLQLRRHDSIIFMLGENKYGVLVKAVDITPDFVEVGCWRMPRLRESDLNKGYIKLIKKGLTPTVIVRIQPQLYSRWKDNGDNGYTPQFITAMIFLTFGSHGFIEATRWNTTYGRYDPIEIALCKRKFKPTQAVGIAEPVLPPKPPPITLPPQVATFATTGNTSTGTYYITGNGSQVQF